MLGPEEIILVFGKREIARLGSVGRRKTFQQQGRVTHDLASEDPGNFSGGKRHN